MTHPDDGRLQAYLDGELPGAGGAAVEEHLGKCERCRETVEELLRAAGVVGAALDRTAPPPPALEAGMARVRRRARRADAGRPSAEGAGGSLPLAKAAVVALLLVAAGSTVLPGSPLREWLVDGWNRVSALVVPEREAGTSPEPGVATAAGVRTVSGEEGVRVVLTGVESGTELRIRFVEGERAGLFAPEGSRFRTGEGRLEAVVAPGPVRVEIPREAGRAEVVVNGTAYVRVGDGRVELRGPAVDSSASGILLRVGSSGP